MTSKQIRQQFLDFFASKGHAIVESSPVVPHDDPTLMFTNAGMNQFKDVFLGTGSRPYKRAADTQKCIRAGGKHNDLDDVGQDTYHHTFFEMLGNWSFGDYFKKEAIAWAWELLTKVWGIDKSRLHATYFQGDTAEGLEPDREAADLWRTVTDIDPSHIHPGNKKDNFWEMGESGPCGPCSEIHIDLTPDKSGGHLVNAGDARVMEIWNLVFIQYNRGSDGKLTPLPAKHVDTGMGFERLCSVLQGMQTGRIGQVSNYDTDVFTPIFAAIRKRTRAPEYKGTLPGQSDEATKRRSDEGKSEPQAEARGYASSAVNVTSVKKPVASAPGSDLGKRQSTTANRPAGDNRQLMIDVSYRVIADHIRTLTFAITDGAMPSNEGRGYVLRRILRRAVRYGRQYLDMHEPFLCDLVQPLVDHMSDSFPELRKAHGGKNVQHVTDILRDEEASFLKTLDRGLRIASAIFAACEASRQFHGVPTFNRAYLRALITQTVGQTGVAKVVTTRGWDELSAPEEGFAETQFMGRLRKLVTDEDIDAILRSPGVVPGRIAFELYATDGFPVDLTQLMAEERGLTVDIAEYERLMEEGREKARAANKLDWLPVDDNIDALIGAWQLEHASQAVQGSEFFGPILLGPHDPKENESGPNCNAQILAWLADGNLQKHGDLDHADRVALVTDRSCFYAEQGGQVGDHGRISTDTGTFIVEDTRRHGVTVLHIGHRDSGILTVGQSAFLQVDSGHRKPTMQNHTATHMLNWALREVLGEHVQQKGSLVDPEKTRFDFSHPKHLSPEELAQIERLVNEQIRLGYEVYDKVDGSREVDQKKAREINTLRAVFGEKYPENVRVVSIGAEIDAMLRDPKNPKWMQYSVEFCGGTHLKNSQEAEEFLLVSEEAVAKGVRRVVGVTANEARLARGRGDELLERAEAIRKGIQLRTDGVGGSHRGHYDLSGLLRDLADAVIPIQTRHQLADQIAVLQEFAKGQEKQAAREAGRGALEFVAELLETKAMDVGGVTVLVGEVPNATADNLRTGIDYVRNKKGSSAVLLATVEGEKVTLVAGMSKDVVEKGVKAGDLIKEISPLVGGKGGGRPDLAQGGGTEARALSTALEKAQEWLGAHL